MYSMKKLDEILCKYIVAVYIWIDTFLYNIFTFNSAKKNLFYLCSLAIEVKGSLNNIHLWTCMTHFIFSSIL